MRRMAARVATAAVATIALVLVHRGLLAARQDAAGSDTIARLEPGQRGQRELSANAAHMYRASLVPGRYVAPRVEQLGIEVSVRVADPEGHELLAATNPTGPREKRTLRFITTATGD